MPRFSLIFLVAMTVFCAQQSPAAYGRGHDFDIEEVDFPRSLDSYHDADIQGVGKVLLHRIHEEPFNLVASLLFLCAIIHTFFAGKFADIAHRMEEAHHAKVLSGEAPRNSVSHWGELMHFLGEVEVIFALWVLPLGVSAMLFHDSHTWFYYITEKVNMNEAVFVFAIMTLASTRPILKCSEKILGGVASRFGGSLKAWWFTILTVGPLLGSFITEPGAMTISALLLGSNLFSLKPSNALKYATLGLLFVNVSVGGTLTNFAAPPVLMVAGPWEWTSSHMLFNFGLKAALGIVVSNAIYFMIFRKEFSRLEGAFRMQKLKDKIQREFITRDQLQGDFEKMANWLLMHSDFRKGLSKEIDARMEPIKEDLRKKVLNSQQLENFDPVLVNEAFEARFEEVKLHQMRHQFPSVLPSNQRAEFIDPDWDKRDDGVPPWVTIVHVLFLTWTVVHAHHPKLFLPGLLFFVGFAQVTQPYQNRLELKTPILVGFFLFGLVIHGGLQAWWIAPVLRGVSYGSLMLEAAILTAFNDNAAITYLSTLVPGFSAELKYAVVAGAVTGGGLTVIANAPNPAGQAILKSYFDGGVSPMSLLKAAIVPTIIVGMFFFFFPG